MTTTVILSTTCALLMGAVVWPFLGPDTTGVPADVVTVEIPWPTPIHERLTDQVAHHGRHELNIAPGTDAQVQRWEGTTEPLERPWIEGRLIEAEPPVPHVRYFTNSWSGVR